MAKVLTVFRNRLKPGNEAAYFATLERMRTLARAMPGFVAAKTFVAEDGERVTLVEFASPEAQAAWREHPEHRAAQAAGRSDFYREYALQVCSVDRESRFP